MEAIPAGSPCRWRRSKSARLPTSRYHRPACQGGLLLLKRSQLFARSSSTGDDLSADESGSRRPIRFQLRGVKPLIFQCRRFWRYPVAERPAGRIIISVHPDRPNSSVRPQPKNKESATAASSRRQRVGLKIQRAPGTSFAANARAPAFAPKRNIAKTKLAKRRSAGASRSVFGAPLTRTREDSAQQRLTRRQTADLSMPPVLAIPRS